MVIQGKMVWDRIKFDFDKGFKGIDLSQFSAIDILSASGTKVNPVLAMTITNENNFKIPIKDLKATFYHNNTLIGDTTSDLASKQFEVPANGELTLTDPVNIYLNKSGLDILKQKVSKQKVTFDYTVKLKIQLLGLFWVPLTYTDKIEW